MIKKTFRIVFTLFIALLISLFFLYPNVLYADPVPVTYTITASAGAGGSISPGGIVTVEEDKNQLFTITPDTGYKIDGVKVDSVPVNPPVPSYEFIGVTRNHTIEATFVKDIDMTVDIVVISENPEVNVLVDAEEDPTVNVGVIGEDPLVNFSTGDNSVVNLGAGANSNFYIDGQNIKKPPDIYYNETVVYRQEVVEVVEVVEAAGPSGGGGSLEVAGLYNGPTTDLIVDGVAKLILRTDAQEKFILKMAGALEDHFSQITGLKERMSNYFSRISDLNSRISDLNEQTEENFSKTNSLEEITDDHSLRISNLEEKTEENFSKTNSLEERVAGLEKKNILMRNDYHLKLGVLLFLIVILSIGSGLTLYKLQKRLKKLEKQ